ncbi:MAG: DUF2490 domain-containing protein [Flavobacteriia bacterium]|nr:DUF2490 domain-containing protein [Flavobacteriia bacterium]
MKYSILFSVFFLSLSTWSQIHFNSSKANQQWGQYYNTFQFSNKFSLQSDIGYRCGNGIQNPLTKLIRTGLYYTINSHFKTGVGYAKFDSYENTERIKEENRLYLEVSYKSQLKSKKIKFDQRFRLEERMFSTSFSNYNQTRLRYLFSTNIELWKSKSENQRLIFIQTNELFYFFSNNSSQNNFEQLRMIFGIGYQPTKNLTFALNYNSQYNLNLSKNKIYETNVFWLTIRHTINYKLFNRTKDKSQ